MNRTGFGLDCLCLGHKFCEFRTTPSHRSYIRSRTNSGFDIKMTQQHEAPYKYEVPLKFKGSEGDVILRSSDDLEFRVYQIVLSQGSPVFDDMFQSPKPVATDESTAQDSLQTVHMQETADVIGSLIELCYPMQDPVIQCLRRLRPVLAAMVKYQMDATRSDWMKKMLRLAAETEPLGTYAVALSLGRISCHYRMENEVRLAARNIIRERVGGTWVEEMDLVSSSDYHRLLEYRRECSERLGSILVVPRIFRNAGDDWVWMKPCAHDNCLQNMVPMFADARYYKVSIWWITYRSRVVAALQRQPWGKTLEDRSLWTDLVKQLVTDCPSCAKSALEQVPLCTERLVKAVEDEISHVCMILWLCIQGKMLTRHYRLS